MNAKILLLPAGLAVLLAGCSLAPTYTRPEASVPADWPKGPAYRDAVKAPGAPAAQDLAWRKFFPDGKLQEVIGMALNHNRDLRLAVLNVARARGLYGIQRAELFPTFDAVGSGRKQRVPASAFGSTGEAITTERYDVNLSVSSWEIDRNNFV